MASERGHEPQAAASPPPAAWAARLGELAGSAHGWILRPRVRLCVIGVILLLLGGLLMTNSVWTLPLVVVGVLMVAVAWIGHRLEGRFAVEWGDAGTVLAFRATIKAAEPADDADDAPRTAGSGHRLARPAEPGAELDPATIIEGEAHTVEIDVADLKALIAAAESIGAEAVATETPAEDIRIRRASQEDARSQTAL